MKYFEHGGGANPYFRYRIIVSIFTEEMYDWCNSYPLHEDFHRWHVEWRMSHNRTYDIVQFESEKAAYMFKIAFSEHIIND